MNLAEQVEQHLEGTDRSVRFIDHPQAASAAQYSAVLGTKLEQQVKVLLVRFKGRPGDTPKGYVAVAVQAQKQVDLNKIQKLLAAKSVRMADKANLQQVYGCTFGEVHPFASLANVELFLDSDLLNEETVFFNAGSLTRSAAIDPQVIVDLEGPTLF